MNNRTLRRLIPLMLAAVMLVTAALALENTTPGTGQTARPSPRNSALRPVKTWPIPAGCPPWTRGRRPSLPPVGKARPGQRGAAEDGTFVYTPL